MGSQWAIRTGGKRQKFMLGDLMDVVWARERYLPNTDPTRNFETTSLANTPRTEINISLAESTQMAISTWWDAQHH